MARRTSVVKTKGWSHQKWLDFRERGLGGSEAATALSVESPELAASLHSSAIKLHLEKIGEPVPIFTGNRWTRAGQLMEPIIADLYAHWDHNNPTFDQCLINKEEGIIHNRLRETKSYLLNSRYPHLFASVDRLILIGGGQPPAIMEAKNTTLFEMQRYENFMSPSFYIQVQTYLMMYERCQYADVAMFQDGNNMEVVRVEVNKEHQKKIADGTGRFWLNVLKARQIKEEYGVDSYFGVPLESFTNRQLEGVEQLQAIEPEPQGTGSELSFVKEMIKPREDETEIDMNEAVFKAAHIINEINATNRESAKVKDAEKAKILIELNGNTKASATKGHVSYKADSRGKYRLYISPKIEF